MLNHVQAQQMIHEALRYSVAQAAELPGVASGVEKDSFLTALLAGNQASLLVAGRREHETAAPALESCPYSTNLSGMAMKGTS